MERLHPSLSRLDERLRSALFLAQPCPVCADIGADHGLLSAALLQSGRTKHVIVSDVSAKSLEKAKRLLASLGLSSSATFLVADGLAALDGIKCEKPGAVYILGMGGNTLSRILKEGANRLGGAELVLGAQTDLPLVRQSLCQIGYRIRQECIAEESRHFYILMHCTPVKGDESAYHERELLLGPGLLRELPPSWSSMLQHRKQLLSFAIASMERSSAQRHISQLPAYQRELQYVEDALALYHKEEQP